MPNNVTPEMIVIRNMSKRKNESKRSVFDMMRSGEIENTKRSHANSGINSAFKDFFGSDDAKSKLSRLLGNE